MKYLWTAKYEDGTEKNFVTVDLQEAARMAELERHIYCGGKKCVSLVRGVEVQE